MATHRWTMLASASKFSRRVRHLPLFSRRIRDASHSIRWNTLFISRKDDAVGTLSIMAEVTTASASSSIVAFACAGLALPVMLLWWSIQPRKSDKPVPVTQAMFAAGVVVDPRLHMRETWDHGVGLCVSSEVPAGTVLVSVPAALVLSGERACAILGADGLEPDVALCALLAEAKRAATRGQDILGLQEYLCALPKSFPSLPFCLAGGDKGAKELAGTALLPAALALRARCLQEREAALTVLGDKLEASWSEDLWFWARAAILTRAGPSLHALHGTSGDAGTCVAIVPLVDFANCAANPSAECCLGEQAEVKLVARHELPAGTEVTLRYGAQSREQLLFTFGFALPELPAVATSPLSLESSDSPVRNALLRLLALDSSSSAGGEDDGIVAFAPPMARLLGPVEHVDVSELWAAANIHKMDEAGLRKVAAAAGASSALPIELGLTAQSPAARSHLHNLLEEWCKELKPLPGRGKPILNNLRSYRADCRAMVEAALKRLQDEERFSLAQATTN